MSLNIKSESVHELARQIAFAEGVSMTSAVEDALRRRLGELKNDERRHRARMLLEEIWDGLGDEDRRAVRQIEDEMYDEAGLPR